MSRALTPARTKPLPKNGEEPKPPHSEEAEKGALGSMLRDPQIIPQAQSKVDVASFYNPVNREIFKRADFVSWVSLVGSKAARASGGILVLLFGRVTL